MSVTLWPAKDKSPTIVAEIETVVRSANKGEWVLGVNGLEQCPGYDHNRYRGYVVKRFLSTEEVNLSLEYPDTNGNGIPDAFENRKPISEILSLTYTT